MTNTDKEIKSIIESAELFIAGEIEPIVSKDEHLQTTPDSYSFFVKVKDKTSDMTEEGLRKKILSDIKDADEISLYVHFPYCKAKCTFCHYVSEPDGNNAALRSYAIDLLKREISLFVKKFPVIKNKKISSLYIGGGTPSLMEKDCIDKLKSIFSDFKFKYDPFTSKDCEKTIEATPESLIESDEKITMLCNNFNRISVGVQTLDETILKEMHREGNETEIIDALSRLFKIASMQDIKTNVDFIYGFPFNGRKIENMTFKFLKDLETVISKENGPNSITLYRLRLKRVDDLESPLMKKYEESPKNFPDQLSTYIMKYAAALFLESRDYKEGPLGWFVKNKNRQSIKIYADRWQKQIPLLGFGVSSYSYTKNVQYRNEKDPDIYKYYIENDELPISSGQIFHGSGKLKRELSYHFKQNDPINISKIPTGEIRDLLDKFLNKSFLEKKGSEVKLSTVGNILVEEIISGYIWEDVKIICCH